MSALSEKQRKVLDYLRRFMESHGYAPSVRDIADGCGLKSAPVAQYYLDVLEKKGFIARMKGVSRSITLPLRAGGSLKAVPLLGIIAAGVPIALPENDTWNLTPEEMVEVSDDILRGRTNVFALKVRGTSMIDALVDDGDTVLLTQTGTAEDGAMVAVWLQDRNEVTLKKIYREGNRIRLQPANRYMEPIFCDPGNVEIQGRVIGIIRKLD
ncbi:transcriptional repressor, LexA family [Dehalogenimonas lykanthroporepellens BL-DC-9]|nr:transcriptional repressor, LexA family [Dehalogenimonas lykanthroporepellens BL-DC-9]